MEGPYKGEEVQTEPEQQHVFYVPLLLSRTAKDATQALLEAEVIVEDLRKNPDFLIYLDRTQPLIKAL